MRWIWTEEKNRTNKVDHGISFETAKLVFNDPLALTRHDSHPDGDRWQTVGLIGSYSLCCSHLANVGRGYWRGGWTVYQRPQSNSA